MHATAAVCGYENRQWFRSACALCRTESACLDAHQGGAAEVQRVDPTSMLLSPLPIEFKPNMCGAILLDISAQSAPVHPLDRPSLRHDGS